MKVLRRIMVIVVASIMVFSWVGCGSSSSSDEAFKILFNLNATQGPNNNVIEPEEALNAVPTANFFLEAEQDAADKAAEIINLIVDITVPQTVPNFFPNDVIVDAIYLGLTMGNIAADDSIAAADTCDQLDTDLGVLTGDPTCYAIPNCAIVPPDDVTSVGGKGKATVNFGDVIGCGFSPTGSDSIGTIAVRGKLFNPLYPAYDPFGNLGYDCSAGATTCKDAKIAAVSSDFGIFGGNQVFTRKSAVVGYVFNYDLESLPDLADLPIFVVANVQIDTDGAGALAPSNMALAVAMPAGINGVGNTYYGGVFDATGDIYGLGYPSGNDTQVSIATLPLQAGGGFCTSTFNNVAGVYTLDVGSDDCGLCAGLVINTTVNPMTAVCP